MTQPTAKTVLVTGASRGIGLLTARTLAACGHHVFAGMRDISGRNREAAQALQKSAAGAGYSLRVVELEEGLEGTRNEAKCGAKGVGVLGCEPRVADDDDAKAHIDGVHHLLQLRE